MSEEVAGTVPVRESHRFDIAALERYMARHVEGFVGPLAVRQFKRAASR